MPRIVYSRHYNIGFYGLERLHPFDSRKYGRAWRLIRRHFGSAISQLHVQPRRGASREELTLSTLTQRKTLPVLVADICFGPLLNYCSP